MNEEDIKEIQEFLTATNQELKLAMVGYKRLNKEVRNNLSFEKYIKYIQYKSGDNDE